MLKNHVLETFSGNTKIKIQLISNLDSPKGEGIVLRVKGNNLVKRLVNRSCSKTSSKILAFAKKAGIPSDFVEMCGTHSIELATLLSAIECFDPVVRYKDMTTENIAA
jgi:hypothetical protein